MSNPTFKDVMGKVLTKRQRMNVRSQKHALEEALADTHHFPSQSSQFLFFWGTNQ